LGRWLVAGVAAAVIGLCVGYVVWDLRTDSLTGPDPTVAPAATCGGGAPTALLAIDAATGHQRWSALVGLAFDIPIAGSTVGIGSYSHLGGLDVGDGHARWCRDLGPADEFDSMVAAGDAFVAGRAAEAGAYRASDGRKIWTRATGSNALSSDGTLAVLADGSGDPPTVRGIDGDTGTQRWAYRDPATSFSTQAPNRLLAATDLGLTYVHDGIGTVAVGPAGPDGKVGVRWSLPLFRPIGLSGGLLVGGVGESLTEPLTRFGLEAVDRGTGAVRWKRSVPGFDARVVDGAVIVLQNTDPRDAPGPDGARSYGPITPASSASAAIATAYDPIDGKVLWRRELPFAARIDVVGDLATVWLPAGPDATGNGHLLALDPASGTDVWKVELANPGRSERYHLGDDVTGVGYDPATDTALVLISAREPHRD